MKNRFGAGDRIGGFGGDGGRSLAEMAVSTDQIAIAAAGRDIVVAAAPKSDGRGGFEIDIARYPADFDLAAAVNLRRANQLGLPPVSEQTVILSTVGDFSERTRVLALDGEKLALRDDELSEWLVNAEKQMFLGTDNHPLFETSLEDTACSIRRLPNGQAAMTEVPRQHVNAVCERLRQMCGAVSRAKANLIVETPVSCVARYFLTATREGNLTRRPGRESEITVFLLVNQEGFGFGLWSQGNGLFSEYSFLAPKDALSAAKKKTAEQKAAKSDPEAEAEITSYVRHAFDQLFTQLTPERLEQMGLSAYAQVVWAADAQLAKAAEGVAQDYAGRSGLEFVKIAIPADEAAASGLLLGSFGFGNDFPSGAEILPPLNLARDLLVLADTEEVQRRRMVETEAMRRRSSAAFTLLAAPVAVTAIILAIFANLVRMEIFNAIRDANADARSAEMKPTVDLRRSAEANLRWYQEYISQVSALRRQQPVGIGLLRQLDSSYPFAIDQTFYISDLKLTPSGDMEIKGLARNKDALTAFLKSLEFAGGSGSGTRLFSNLAYEIRESSQPTVGTAGRPLPTVTGSALTTAPTASPGTFAWSIKGNYAPVAEFAPPDPAKKAAQPAPAVPAPTPAR